MRLGLPAVELSYASPAHALSSVPRVFVTLDALKTSLPQESIEVVEEIKCTNAQLMDLASLKEAVKLHTLDLRCVVCMARARFTAHRPQL